MPASGEYKFVLREIGISILEEGVILDNNENLYQTLKDASIVVSLDFTTVLYESIFFTKKI